MSDKRISLGKVVKNLADDQISQYLLRHSYSLDPACPPAEYEIQKLERRVKIDLGVVLGDRCDDVSPDVIAQAVEESIRKRFPNA